MVGEEDQIALITVALHGLTALAETRRLEDSKKRGAMLTKHNDLPAEHEAIVSAVIGCGITVHRELGPGFKECIYHRAFRLELEERGWSFES